MAWGPLRALETNLGASKKLTLYVRDPSAPHGTEVCDLEGRHCQTQRVPETEGHAARSSMLSYAGVSNPSLQRLPGPLALTSSLISGKVVRSVRAVVQQGSETQAGCSSSGKLSSHERERAIAVTVLFVCRWDGSNARQAVTALELPIRRGNVSRDEVQAR